MDNLERDIAFSIEIEKMKKIFRRTKIIGEDRRENDAEHCFHIAVNAIIFKDYCEFDFDLDKSIQMLLVHDLVEIYAGDTFAYDKNGYIDKLDREKEAMDIILSKTSEDFGNRINSLWLEFEEGSTNEAKYANAMDRLQPILANIQNKGGTWFEYSVEYKAILERIEPIKEFSRVIYDRILGEIDEIRNEVSNE